MLEENGQSLDLLNVDNNTVEKIENTPVLDYRKDFLLDDQGKSYICFKGDEHLGSKHHDIDLHKRTIEWILKKPNMYVILMGDALETATRDSIGAAVFEQDKLVQEQLDAYVELHKPLAKAGRILGIHVGNHEWRVYKHSGLNLTKVLVSMLSSHSNSEIKYFDHGIAHYYQIGNQGYTLYTTHGGSNGSSPMSKLKACIDLERIIDVDIYAMGHTHHLGYQSLRKYEVDKRTRKVFEQEKHYISTGSFLSYWGSYAHQSGYTLCKKGSPVLELSGTERKIKIHLPN